jgi:hypothetical protein
MLSEVYRTDSGNAAPFKSSPVKLTDLETIVDRINDTQGQLIVALKMKNSLPYRCVVSLYDALVGVFGSVPQRPQDIYDLFFMQKTNIDELNGNISSLVKFYESNLAKLGKTLTHLIEEAPEKYKKISQLRDSDFSEHVANWHEFERQIASLSPNEDPEKYFNALSSLRAERLKTVDAGTEYNLNKLNVSFQQKRIANLLAVEYSFKVINNYAKLVLETSKSCQQFFADTAHLQRDAHELGSALGMSRDTLKMMLDYGSMLSAGYSDAVAKISGIKIDEDIAAIDEHVNSAQQLLGYTNSSMRSNVKALLGSDDDKK